VRNYLIGVDLGTNGIKTAILDLQGNVLQDSYRETTIYYPRPGLVEQNPDEFYKITLYSIKDVLERSKVAPGQILAVGFDGQMGGVLGIDRNYNPVTHYDIVLDTRCQKYSDLLRDRYEDLIFKHTCGSPCHAPKILWWKNERKDIYKKIHKFIVLSSYVVGKMAGLSGDEAFIDHTNLSFSGLNEATKLTWSEEICGLLGVDMDKLPRVVKPWKIVGKVDRISTRICGLKEGTPLVAGAGDQPAGFLGAGMTKPGLAIDVAGSSSVFSICTDKFVPDLQNKTIVYMNSVIPTLYYPLSYISGGGLSLRWFRDQFAHEEKREAAKRGINIYALLDEKSRSLPPGSCSLLFIPHLGGRACPYDFKVRGAWIGLNWGHTKAHLYRAILESIAYDYYYALKLLKKLFLSVKIETVRVIGGGARSDFWNQIKADVLNIPYIRLDKKELAILGSAIIAGYAVEAYHDLSDTSQALINEVSRINPDVSNHQIYKKFAQHYENLLNQLKPTFHSLLE